MQQVAWRKWAWCLVPAVLAWFVYERAAGFGFVNYDDSRYFYENPHVLGGLTPENAKWAFEIHGPSMWVPLTWLSHQTMVSLFGVEAGPQHVLNIILHAANASLLMAWLWYATGMKWRSLVVASIFAVHPIHAESIAWVTERKDVLSLFFCLLTLIAYLCYVKCGNRWMYAGAVLGCSLAVMAKPLAVTLPCVLFLLDFWPLRRRITVGLVAEKLPLFGIIGVASWLTVLCQNSIGAIASTADFPLGLRISNAALSYATYLKKLILPNDLAVFYPYSAGISSEALILSSLTLASVSLLIWRSRRQIPALLVGWLWFLGTLVPMIGLVQAGAAAMADRYAYFSFIGLYFGVVWGVSDTFQRWRFQRAAPTLALIVVTLLTWRGWVQVGVWKNSQALFRQAISVTDNNYLAHNNLGLALENLGSGSEARAEYLKSLTARPNYAEAGNNLGILEARSGRYEEAERRLTQVVSLTPSHSVAWHNLGKVRAAVGNADAARAAFVRSIELAPDFTMPRYDLAGLEISLGHWREARTVLRALLERSPEIVNGWVNLGYVETKLRDFIAAEESYRQAVALGSSQAASNLSLQLIEQGKLTEAKEFAKISNDVSALHRLGEAMRLAGKLDEAREILREVLAIQADFPDAQNDLGVVLGQMGDHAAAAMHFQAALLLQPDHRAAAINLQRAKAAQDEAGD